VQAWTPATLEWFEGARDVIADYLNRMNSR
jgi:hypothetical protein